MAIPIYALVANVLGSAYRIAERARQGEWELNAVEALSTVNPMQAPAGEIDLGDARVRWRARALADPVQAVAHPRGVAPFRVGLYDTAVEVVDQRGQLLHGFALKQVGYLREALRPPAIPGP